MRDQQELQSAVEGLGFECKETVRALLLKAATAFVALGFREAPSSPDLLSSLVQCSQRELADLFLWMRFRKVHRQKGASQGKAKFPELKSSLLAPCPYKRR